MWNRPNFHFCCVIPGPGTCSLLLHRPGGLLPSPVSQKVVPSLPTLGWPLLYIRSVGVSTTSISPSVPWGPAHAPPSRQAGFFMASTLSLTLSQSWDEATQESRLPAALLVTWKQALRWGWGPKSGIPVFQKGQCSLHTPLRGDDLLPTMSSLRGEHTLPCSLWGRRN